MSIMGLQVIESIYRAKMTEKQRQQHANKFCQKLIKKVGHAARKMPVPKNKTFLLENAKEGSFKGMHVPPRGAAVHTTKTKGRLAPGTTSPRAGSAGKYAGYSSAQGVLKCLQVFFNNAQACQSGMCVFSNIM